MISIKDFRVGEPAYMLEKHRTKEDLTKVEVISIGRKYVKVKCGSWCVKEFEVNFSPYALCEKTEYTVNSMLFTSEQKYEEYKEIKKLEFWLNQNIHSVSNKYSLETLRKLQDILSSEVITE